jgi:hypothetical protein
MSRIASDLKELSFRWKEATSAMERALEKTFKCCTESEIALDVADYVLLCPDRGDRDEDTANGTVLYQISSNEDWFDALTSRRSLIRALAKGKSVWWFKDDVEWIPQSSTEMLLAFGSEEQVIAGLERIRLEIVERAAKAPPRKSYKLWHKCGEWGERKETRFESVRTGKELMEEALDESGLGREKEEGLLALRLVNLKNFPVEWDFYQQSTLAHYFLHLEEEK